MTIPIPVKHLITGGARSGKSTFALNQALGLAPSGPVGFIATAQAFDDDMADRIRRHQGERDSRFITFEAPIDPGPALADPRPAVFIVDCLTLWCSNVLFSDAEARDGAIGHVLTRPPDRPHFEACVDRLLRQVMACDRPVLLVTNEVGLGIVPADVLSRTYRDWLGRLNQRAAAACERVTLLISGIPVHIKGSV